MQTTTATAVQQKLHHTFTARFTLYTCNWPKCTRTKHASKLLHVDNTLMWLVDTTLDNVAAMHKNVYKTMKSTDALQEKMCDGSVKQTPCKPKLHKKSTDDLDNSVHEAGVHVDDENANECHLLPCVLKDEVWIVRFTAQAVGSHHHRQIACIHLSDSCVLSCSKHL